MTQRRNISNDTVQDFLTGKSVEPDEVVDIPDEFDSFYVNHPVLQEIGAAPAPKTKTAETKDNAAVSADSDSKEQSE